jgi:hypothetical protein
MIYSFLALVATASASIYAATDADDLYPRSNSSLICNYL